MSSHISKSSFITPAIRNRSCWWETSKSGSTYDICIGFPIIGRYHGCLKFSHVTNLVESLNLVHYGCVRMQFFVFWLGIITDVLQLFLQRPSQCNRSGNHMLASTLPFSHVPAHAWCGMDMQLVCCRKFVFGKHSLLPLVSPDLMKHIVVCKTKFYNKVAKTFPPAPSMQETALTVPAHVSRCWPLSCSWQKCLKQGWPPWQSQPCIPNSFSLLNWPPIGFICVSMVL